jgi:hypothetical protein
MSFACKTAVTLLFLSYILNLFENPHDLVRRRREREARDIRERVQSRSRA